MGDPTGEANRGALRRDFDRRLLLQFRGSAITSDAGLLPYRELDDAVDLTDTAANTLAEARTGKNGRHRLAGLLRQSVFGRLAGYEDVPLSRESAEEPMVCRLFPVVDPAAPAPARQRRCRGRSGDAVQVAFFCAASHSKEPGAGLG